MSGPIPHYGDARKLLERIADLEQQLAAARDDTALVDWLETQECWIGLRETMVGVEPLIGAGKGYTETVRKAYAARQKGGE